MIQIAVYGKGGIGKSTISANVSYELAKMGKHVLQIGCDPKHDSTRALLNGREQVTVLNYIRNRAPYDRRLEDIVIDGVLGIKCVEAGGPEPGIGCAGRGILSTFDTLRKLGLDDLEFDVKLYDVLGDVVCGGFAVPLRNEYADAVFLVTSGEFMSIYAANNILKGILNFNKGVPRVAGIILNCRGMEEEYEIVKRFADAVGLPIVATIPRSDLFAKSESESRTVSELYSESAIAEEMRGIASMICNISDGNAGLNWAKPLTDRQLSQLVKGELISQTDEFIGAENLPCRKCEIGGRALMSETRILHSCAMNGATYGCVSITDSVTIIHGPRSCAHLVSSSKTYGELRKRRNRVDKFDPPSRRIYSTEMDDTVSVFGGNDLLEQKIRDLIMEGKRNIFIVTTCVSGIIGDNPIDVASTISRDHPDVYIGVVEADGNIAGDWGDGYALSADSLIELVDRSVKPEPGLVNLIGERYFFKIEEYLDNEVYDLFKLFNLKINCRFMYEAEIDEVRNLLRGSMNFISNNDEPVRKISKLLKTRLNIDVDPIPLPTCLSEFRAWAERMGQQLGMEDHAMDVISEAEESYMDVISKCRSRMEGKKIIIEDRFTKDIDWLIELLLDLGADILLVGLGPTHIWKEGMPKSRYEDKLRFIRNYSQKALLDDADRMKPDMIFGDSSTTSHLGIRHVVYSRPGVGLEGIKRYARRISDLTRVPKVEGWKDVL